MLREVKNGGWVPRGFWFWKRYVFVAGRVSGLPGVRPALMADMAEAQVTQAVPVLAYERRTYWWCMDRFFWEDDGLSAEDVHALVYERQVRAQRKIQRAHATVALGTSPSTRREPIPRDVRLAVWQRDGGKCVECGSTFEIQYDHIIPVVMGGATSVENLQILCGECNRRKGGSLG